MAVSHPASGDPETPVLSDADLRALLASCAGTDFTARRDTARLAHTRWPGELDGLGWENGTSPAFLRELVAWWQTGFDWRAQEAALNRFPQFRATVDGIGLHFVHVRARGRRRCRWCVPTAGRAPSMSCCRWWGC